MLDSVSYETTTSKDLEGELGWDTYWLDNMHEPSIILNTYFQHKRYPRNNQQCLITRSMLTKSNTPALFTFCTTLARLHSFIHYMLSPIAFSFLCEAFLFICSFTAEKCKAAVICVLQNKLYRPHTLVQAGSIIIFHSRKAPLTLFTPSSSLEASGMQRHRCSRGSALLEQDGNVKMAPITLSG